MLILFFVFTLDTTDDELLDSSKYIWIKVKKCFNDLKSKICLSLRPLLSLEEKKFSFSEIV